MTEFKPTVDSLLDYECPKWFRDAKFGIYVHWGPYSVAERNEWYARTMYIEGHPDYEYHCKRFGHPTKFGYKDLIPMWRAENWDPDALVTLFKRAGAKYFTPCAVHHDNFDLWDSKHHKWNSVAMGPKRDITAEWREATLKQGLRFGVTTHLSRAYSWFNTNKGADKRGDCAGIRYDGADPALSDFYFEDHADTNPQQTVDPPAAWREQWVRRIKDLIDQSHPDHLYFDGAVPFRWEDRARSGLDVIAHFYNHNMSQHGASQEGIMAIKRVFMNGYYFDGIATLDMERTKADFSLLYPWQTDTAIGPWSYNPEAEYRSATEIIHELIDIVSKNGNQLLNVPPRADGTLDDATVSILEAIGAWLDVNGDAIYETRPWKKCGEKGVSFTCKGDTVYAIVRKFPEEGAGIELNSLGKENGGSIASIEMPGDDRPVVWHQEVDRLRIEVPLDRRNEHATVLRIAPQG